MEKSVNHISKKLIPAIILGAIVFMELHYHYKITNWVAGVSCGTIVIATTGFMVFSRSISCIVSLLVPMLGSKVGKSMLVTLLTTMLVNGPVANLHHNFKQTTQSLMCFGESAFNETNKASENHRELMREISGKFGTSLTNYIESIKSIQSVVKSFDNSLQITSDGLDSAVNGLESGMNLCRETMISANGSCNFKMNNVRTKCLNFFKGRGLFSPDWLIDLKRMMGFDEPKFNLSDRTENLRISSICDLFSTNLCSFTADICNGIKEVGTLTLSTLATIPKLIQMLVGELEVGINYNRKLESLLNNTGSFEEIKRNVTTEVDFLVDQLLNTVQGITTKLNLITLIIVLISTWLYYLRFRNSYVFDNIYINKEIENYDIKYQAETQSPSLFPLKGSQEKKEVIDCLSLKLAPKEFKSLVTSLIIYSIVVVITIIVFLTDWILYRATDIIQRNGRAVLNVEVKSDHQLSVKGDGFMSHIFRLFIQEFNHKSFALNHLDTIRCLPEARQITVEKLIGPVIVVIIFGLVVLLQPYFLRSRSIIAGYFYPVQKQERVAFLYCEMFGRRQAFKSSLNYRIPGRLKENQKLTELCDKKGFCILIWLGFFRRYCLYCDDKVKKLNLCNRSENCPALYCNLCWSELQSCVLCEMYNKILRHD